MYVHVYNHVYFYTIIYVYVGHSPAPEPPCDVDGFVAGVKDVLRLGSRDHDQKPGSMVLKTMRYL